MCPMCDLRCSYWDYSNQCTNVKASNLFDNYATVAFSVFMSLWGTFFLEFWKREEATIRWRWNLMTSGSRDEEVGGGHEEDGSECLVLVAFTESKTCVMLCNIRDVGSPST